MCQSEETNPSLPKRITSASASASAAKKVPRKKHQYGDRGSWIHFIANSFHGVLGSSSLLVTIAAWISNESLALTLLSVITTTVLSIHSSNYMLDQSPHQSTILDCQFKLGSKDIDKTKNDSLRLRVVAPHRGAFHRTSIIMQYANSRILLLLQRKHWHELSESAFSTSAILSWGLVCVMCLRMLLGEKMPSFFGKSKAKRKTISSNDNNKTSLKPLPPFWKNGNTYCFVLPMIASVFADFLMSVWCEYCYFSLPQKAPLFGFFTEHWISLWHLLFLQVVAHVIAFSFTLAFRIKHTKNKETSNPTNKSLVRRFYNIKTLYWVCTAGVYALVFIGLVKARTTLQVLIK